MLKLYTIVIIGMLGLSDVAASGWILCGGNNDLAVKEPLKNPNASSTIRSCLRVDSEEDAFYAEGNIASFFYRNKDNIATLKKMGALDKNIPRDLEYLKVKEILLKIWSSETMIAACFKTMTEKSTADLINFQDQVWQDSYQLHSEELNSVGQLKQMLNLLSALIDISLKVL